MWFVVAPADLLEAPNLPFRFELDAVLPAAPAQVFAVLAEPSTWPSWYADMKRAHWIIKNPRGVGSLRQVDLAMLSARERFLVWQPGRRLAFTVTEASLPLVDKLVEDFVLQPTNAGTTRLTWRIHYRPTWWLRPLHAVMRLVFGRLFARSVDGLAAYLSKVAPAPVLRAA
jgi:hypothetical protein